MIRKLEDSDLDKALNIWLEASIVAHDFIPATFWMDKVEAMKTIYLPSAENYVFVLDNQVTGFISLVENAIAAIFVDPQIQGRGHGKTLLNHAKSLRPALELSVYSRNYKSIEFYKRQGFLILREEVDPETGEQSYVMTWHCHS